MSRKSTVKASDSLKVVFIFWVRCFVVATIILKACAKDCFLLVF